MLTHCQLLAIDYSTNATLETAVGGGIVTMASEMPKFVSVGPTPNRTKEITVIYTLTFSGFEGDGPPGVESVRIALNRLSSMQNWLPGYNLRFELIDDVSNDSIVIPELLSKVINAADHPFVPLVLLSEVTTYGQLIPATFLKELNFISQSLFQNSLELDIRKNDLTNYIALGPPISASGGSTVGLFKSMGWTKYSLVTELIPFWILVCGF